MHCLMPNGAGSRESYAMLAELLEPHLPRQRRRGRRRISSDTIMKVGLYEMVHYGNGVIKLIVQCLYMWVGYYAAGRSRVNIFRRFDAHCFSSKLFSSFSSCLLWYRGPVEVAIIFSYEHRSSPQLLEGVRGSREQAGWDIHFVALSREVGGPIRVRLGDLRVSWLCRVDRRHYHTSRLRRLHPDLDVLRQA